MESQVRRLHLNAMTVSEASKFKTTKLRGLENEYKRIKDR